MVIFSNVESSRVAQFVVIVLSSWKNQERIRLHLVGATLA